MIPMCVKNGDVVLLPNYGGHKVNLKDGDYFIYRDTDILGSFKEWAKEKNIFYFFYQIEK